MPLKEVVDLITSYAYLREVHDNISLTVRTRHIYFLVFDLLSIKFSIIIRKTRITRT